MRILQLIQKTQLRGAEIFACQLSNHLLDLGHDVMMVSLVGGEAILPFRREIHCLQISLRHRLFNIKAWRRLSEVIKTFNPDIIQANAGDTLKTAVCSKLVFRWHTPIIYRNANKVSDFISSSATLLFNKFLVHQVQHVVSVSQICKADFIKTYGVSESSVSMVPIGIEIVEYKTALPRDLTIFFDKGTILVNVASLVPEKNHEALLRIMQILTKRHNATLLIIGDGRLRATIQQQIEAYNLSNHVFLLGYRNDVMNILAHASAFLLPSLIEGLPAVILESFYSKVPVISYNVGGISEVVSPNKTGWLINKNDEAAFLNAVEEVLEDKEKAAAIANNASHRVEMEFDNTKIALQFEAVYKTVLT